MSTSTVAMATLRLAGTAGFVTLILIVSALPLASSQSTSTQRYAFFERLMVGGAEKGKIYIEIPLKAMFFGSPKTPRDRWAVWDAFFTRVLRERPDSGHPGPVA